MGKPDTTYTDEMVVYVTPPRRAWRPIAKTFRRITRQKRISEEMLPLVEQQYALSLYREGAGDSAIRRLADIVKRIDRLVRVAHADTYGRPPLKPEGFPEGEWLLKKTAELTILDKAPKPILQGRHLIDLASSRAKTLAKLTKPTKHSSTAPSPTNLRTRLLKEPRSRDFIILIPN